MSFAPLQSPDAGRAAVRVAVDATAVVPGRKGLGRFQARLLAELGRRWPGLVEVTALTVPGFDAPWPPVPGWVQVEVAGGNDIDRAGRGVPAALRRVRPQVVLAATDRLRVPSALPVVLYVFEHPMYRARLQRLTGAPRRDLASDAITRRWFPRSVRRADRIVAASTSTARDLVFLAGADPNRVSVAMPGPFAEPMGKPQAERDRERVVLAFVDRDPRDNGVALIDGFTAGASAGWELHVVGDADPFVVAHARRRARPDAAVSFLGRLSDPAVAEAYGRASIYLDASLYEGFGAQAAEATAAGLACVVSNVTSLPEVAGRAAVLVDPHDPATIASALATLTARSPAGLVAELPSGPASDTGRSGDCRWAALTGHLVALSQQLAARG